MGHPPRGIPGLQIRGKIDNPAALHVGGYQADIDAGNGYTGIIYDEGGVAGGRGIMSNRGEKTLWDADNKRSATPLNKTSDEIKAVIKPVGEWNDVAVIVDGNRITYSINGQVTTELTDNSPKACKDGVIGLQMHAGHTMTLQFKDMKIKIAGPEIAQPPWDARESRPHPNTISPDTGWLREEPPSRSTILYTSFPSLSSI